MSAAAAPPTPARKSKKERKERAPAVAERLKSVVRRLPPNLPEEVFWQSVGAWVTEETVAWKMYYAGKVKKRLNKENIPSRAYIAFRSEETLATFGREYDGHLFRDKQGNEYQAVVEYAPYQKIPSEKKKVDARNATIEKDEDYTSFVESLEASAAAEPPSLEALIAAAQPPKQPKTTPLLEALKAEKSAHKDKEAILRAHAHYGKDPSAILAPPPRAAAEASKKKGNAPPHPAPQQKQPTAAGEIGKKAAAAAKKVGLPPGQGQKAGQGKSAAAGPSGAPPSSQQQQKSTKPPRPPKGAGTVAQGQAQHKAPKAANAPAPAPPNVLPPVATPGQPQAAPAPAPVPTPRRTRPVIGLASRQFEAALSGAGVSAAGGERGKSRREREKEKEKEAPQGQGQAEAPTTTHGTNGKAGGQPPSPRRARHHKERTDTAKDGAATAPGGGAQQVKVPGILQPPPLALGGEEAGHGASSGRSGGRGRGRGRGGAGIPAGGAGRGAAPGRGGG